MGENDRERGRNGKIVISKREKLQYVCTFVTDILSLALSIALGWLVVDGLLGKVGNYTAPDLIQAFCLLMLAYLLTFLTFDQSENITTRPWKRELKISVEFNLILTLINSAGLLLTKAPLLSSRYFLVAVPVINVVLMTVFHSVLKKLLTTTRKKNSMESLVGVVTTGEDAGEMVRELQRDWSKRLTGIALLEIPEEQIGGQIEGVDIKANYDTFMDWLRQAALDEVYVDIPMDSGDSFVPYLKEMESMGLTVHFRLPLPDRIEDVCCDETAAPAAMWSPWAPWSSNSATRPSSGCWTLWAVWWAASSAFPSLPSWPSPSSWKAPARWSSNSAVWAATAVCSISTSSEVCMWTRRSGRKS